MKKFKILFEMVAQKETEHGAIGLKESGKITKEISSVAKKNNMDCYVKGYPKEKTDHIPTHETYEIRTLEDITKLSASQFEFFIDDLRNYCDIMRQVNNINSIVPGTLETNGSMKWIDTGLNESKINFETSNKL